MIILVLDGYGKHLKDIYILVFIVKEE